MHNGTQKIILIYQHSLTQPLVNTNTVANIMYLCSNLLLHKDVYYHFTDNLFNSVKMQDKPLKDNDPFNKTQFCNRRPK